LLVDSLESMMMHGLANPKFDAPIHWKGRMVYFFTLGATPRICETAKSDR